MAHEPACLTEMGQQTLFSEGPDRISPHRAAPRRPGPLRVVVCGEVSSGKSAVLNALLRDRILPDNLGANIRPGVTLRGGAPRLARQRQDGGLITEVATAEALRNAGHIHLHSPLPHLDGIEVTELALTTAAELSAAQRDAVRAADALIWVTIGSQAWRLTERKILDALEEVCPARALIVISRADKLRSETDRLSIIDRLRRESEGRFSAILPLYASRMALEEAARSQDHWAATGGAELAGHLLAWRDALLAVAGAGSVAGVFAPQGEGRHPSGFTPG